MLVVPNVHLGTIRSTIIVQGIESVLVRESLDVAELTAKVNDILLRGI